MPSLLHALTLACLSFAPPDPVFEPVDIPPPANPTPSFERRTFEDDPIAVQQIVLANGLTVLLSENHDQPEVFGAVVVRAGGKNDPLDNTGMAHYLEHMLFKGTKTLGTTNWGAEEPLQAKIVELYERHKRADTDEQRAKLQAEIAATVQKTYAYVIPNELDRMLEALGSSDVNAYTSEDETVYHNLFPASQIEPWLQIYAHRFADPVFRLFPTELEAVYEEKNTELDQFEFEVQERLMARAFPQHPYGMQPLIGTVEHLKSPSLLAMQEYFDKYYVANNMALVLAGDFDTEAILPIIAEHFGAWRSGPDPEPLTNPVEPFVGRELVKLRVTPFRAGAYAFRTPTPSHPDYAALQVVRELLFNEQGSGFIDNLANEGKIMGAFLLPNDLADHNLDVVFFFPRVVGQTFESAERRVLEQYRRVARGEFDEQRMLSIRDGLRRAADRQWEDSEERAWAIVDSFVAYDGWQGYLDYRERVAGLTREDVMRVASTYFGDDYLAMRSRVGFPKKLQLKKPGYPPVTPKPNVRSSFHEQILARPSSMPTLRHVDFDADVQTMPLAEHVLLRSNENPFNDTYTLRLMFGVGTERIRELVVAAPYLERIGTRTHSPTVLDEKLSLLGTTLEIFVGMERLHVKLTGPEQHLPEALSLVEDLLREPVADDKRWKALRGERATMRRMERTDPASLIGRLVDYATYGEQSFSLRDYGPRGARSLSPEELLDAWQRAQGYALDVCYTGQREPNEVVEILRQSLAGSLEIPRVPAVPHEWPEWVLPERDTVFFMPKRNQIQTQMVFVVRGDAVPREQIAAADAYNEYMGGSMTGLVFQEIREFRALAYSAQGYYLRENDIDQAGWFAGSVTCQADKTFEAIDVMMGLIRGTPAKSEHMDSIRSALTRNLETQSPGFRELHSWMEFWRNLGYDDDPRKWLIEDYAKLEFEDIQAFHAAQVAERPLILMIVGDPRRVDVDELSRYGEVIEVAEREVFSR